MLIKLLCFLGKYIYNCINRFISQVGRLFANGPVVWCSIPCRVIPKTQNLVYDAALLNTQHYKAWIKVKVEQARQRSCTLLYTTV